MLANSQFSYLPYDDYAQSANTLFHFMTKPEYLDSVLRRRAIIPRYCVETIDYLNIHNGTRAFIVTFYRRFYRHFHRLSLVFLLPFIACGCINGIGY